MTVQNCPHREDGWCSNCADEVASDLDSALNQRAVLTDKLARLTAELIKMRAHLSTGGKYAIEREDKATMDIAEELMWSDIFEKLDAFLPPIE